MLEACGLLEESLDQYKKSKEFGVERAAMHMRNVRSLRIFWQACIDVALLLLQVSAKILGKQMKEAEAQTAEGKSEPSP